MCGITGIFHFDRERPVDRMRLQSMTDVIHYRGPDGEGFYINGPVGLGHRRLSIIDLSSGDQPMYSEDRQIVVVLNGEIYNYIELRDELRKKGHVFRTTSDTEVVIAAYKEWGVDCQNKFNGMWAIALWDEQKKQLFITRDRIGEKPVHYCIYDNTLIFGSEIKSLLTYGVPKEPRLELMEIYAVFKSIPAPNTFYKDIYKLMPGHYLLANPDGMKEIPYWDMPAIEEDHMLTNKKAVYEEFEALFEDAIRIRMRCDVPFGAFLSGGLDSASIVALMSNHSSFPIKTFTIGYAENEFDESSLAKLVAEKFHTDHHLGIVTDEGFEEVLHRIVHHYDEPFGDSSAIPTGYVSKFASEHVKMVLTGDGGDEVLSGYESYKGIKFAQKYQQLPQIVQKGIPSLLTLSSQLMTGKYRYKMNRYRHVLASSAKPFNERLLEKRAKPNLQLIQSLINQDIETWDSSDYLEEYMSKCPYKDEFYRQMYLNFKFDLPNDYLVKVDRMSMAYSIETRLPFLDVRLIEFMAKVDKTVKMEGMERKSILRNTVAQKLPPALLGASKKGFRVPVREWLKKDELKPRLDALKTKNVYNSMVIDQLITENKTGKSDHGNLLWSLMVLNEMIG